MTYFCSLCVRILMAIAPLPLLAETPFLIYADYSDLQTPYNYNEFMEIKVPEYEAKNKWQQITRYASEDGISSFEWIPKGEKLENRTEILTIQFLAKKTKDGNPSTAKQIVTNIFKQGMMQFPDMAWNTIQDDDNDFMYEWSLPYGGEGMTKQHEIVRIVSTDKGFHRIAYEKRVPKIDEHTKQLWICRLGASRLYTSTPQ